MLGACLQGEHESPSRCGAHVCAKASLAMSYSSGTPRREDRPLSYPYSLTYSVVFNLQKTPFRFARSLVLKFAVAWHAVHAFAFTPFMSHRFWTPPSSFALWRRRPSLSSPPLPHLHSLTFYLSTPL